MLTNVISYAVPKCARCLKVISWKHSFNRLNEENEIAKKKKQALDSLFERGKISQSTHDSFNAEIATAIAEIEKQQQELINKMAAKSNDLQNQIKTLEILLANYEIQHVAGEIDENTYTLEINLLTNGLETAKRELETIQTAMDQLCKPIVAEPIAQPAEMPTVEVAPAQPQETAEVAVAAVEAAPLEVAPAEVIAAPPEIIPEPVAEPMEPTVEVPIAEAPAQEPEPVEQTPSDSQVDIVLAATPEPMAETVEVAPEPEAVVEIPVIEEAPVVEAPTMEEAAPIVEEPAIVEQPAVDEAPTVEIPVEQPTIVEEAVVEQPEIKEPAAETMEAETPVTEEMPVAEEIDAPETAAVVEEEVVEKRPLDEFDVAEPDVVQQELLQPVEEIVENPFQEAPVEAQEEVIADAPIEMSDEIQPVPVHSAKESLPEVSSSDDEENRE
jgi:hypothetical protein